MAKWTSPTTPGPKLVALAAYLGIVPEDPTIPPPSTSDIERALAGLPRSQYSGALREDPLKQQAYESSSLLDEDKPGQGFFTPDPRSFIAPTNHRTSYLDKVSNSASLILQLCHELQCRDDSVMTFNQVKKAIQLATDDLLGAAYPASLLKEQARAKR